MINSNKFSIAISYFFILIVLFAGVTLGVNWDNGGDDSLWSTDQNWVGDVEPTSADSVWLNTANDYALIQSGDAAECLDITLGRHALNCHIEVTGGSLDVYGQVFLGQYSDASGTLTISGGEVNIDSFLYVGSAGPGTLNMSGGELTVNSKLDLGHYGSGSGTVNLTGGKIVCQEFNMIENPLFRIAAPGELVIAGDARGDLATYMADNELVAFDGVSELAIDYNETYSDKTTVRIKNANYGPTATAPGDFTITLPDNDLMLYGTASDEGLPNPPGQMTVQWTKLAGPYDVTFDDANSASTMATFGGAGVYTLELEVSDGALIATDEVVITVEAPVNQAPNVYAGADQTVMVPFYSADLNGMAEDDGLPGAFIVAWSVVSKPAGSTLSFPNANVLDPTVTFDEYGDYVLKLVAYDGVLFDEDTVTITFAQSAQKSPALIADPIALFTLDQDPVDADNGLGSIEDATGHTAGGLHRTDMGLPGGVDGAAHFTGKAWDFGGTEANFKGLSSNEYFHRLGHTGRTDGMSASLWVNAQNNGTNVRLGGSGWGGVMELNMDKYGVANGIFGGSNVVSTGASLLDGDWHHVAWTVDFTSGSNNIKIYVDGVLNNSASRSYTSRFNDTRTDHNLVIGARPTGGTSYFWYGLMDDFAVFDRALDASDISYLAKGLRQSLLYRMDQVPVAGAGAIADATGNTSGTIAATLPSAVEGAAGDAWDFASTTSALTIAADETTDNFGDTANTSGLSVALWINNDSAAGIVGQSVTGFGSVWDFSVAADETLVATVGGAVIGHDDTVVDLFDGKWHHVAVCADFASGDVEMFIDGYFHGSMSYSFSDFADAASDIIVGADSAGANSWGGMIDEFSIFEYSLNGREVAHLAPRRVPDVNAGDDQTVALPGYQAALSGSVDYDHMPSTATSSVQWSVVSGPSDVTFDDAGALNTTATFAPVAGEYNRYILRLTATDGGLTSFDDIIVVFYVDRDLGMRTLSATPMINVHPRILFAPEDIPEIRNRALNEPLGKACMASMKDHLVLPDNIYNASGIGAVYNQLKVGNDTANIDPYVWNPGEGEDTVQAYFRGTHRLFGQLWGAAYIAMVEEDEVELSNLATALATAAKINFVGYEPRYEVWNCQELNPDLAMAYDLLYDYMTVAERDHCRKLISKMTKYRVANGAGEEPYQCNTNHKAHHDHIVIASLAIEGEEGYDERVYELNKDKLKMYFTDYGIHESGYAHEGWVYFGFSQIFGTPAALAQARRDENFFATSRLYDAYVTAFYELDPWSQRIRSHHDGSDTMRSVMHSIFEYMYPDNKIISFTTQRAYDSVPWDREDKRDIVYGLFAGSKFPNDMTAKDIAEEYDLPSTKFCKDRGMVNARSSWDTDALRLDFECRMDLYTLGHVHSNRNSFTFFGKERVWAFEEKGPQGNENDGHATVLIDGVGQGGSSGLQDSLSSSAWPGLPGKFLDYEDNALYTMGVGDAKPAYDYVRDGDFTHGALVSSPFVWADFLYDVAPEDIEPWRYDVAVEITSGQLRVYNPVQRAFRSAVLVRGDYPYVLIVDDIQKDNGTHNYEWIMNLMPYDDFTKVSGDTDEIIIRHNDDTDPNDPRLLVRAVQADGTPGNLVLQNRSYTGDSYGTVLGIPRNNVVTPNYKVIMYPHYGGDAMPVTTWNGSELTVTIGSQSDVIDFTMGLDGRTYLNITRDGCVVMPSDGDITDEGDVDLDDLARMAESWKDCYTFEDLLIIAENWLME